MEPKLGDYSLSNKIENNLSSIIYSAPIKVFQSISDNIAVNRSFEMQNDQPTNSTTMTTYFEEFTSFYSQVHGYLSLIVCVFGIIANLVNVLVLTRKEMRTPTNAILTGIAIADLLVMADYVPYNIHNNIQNLPESERLTLTWAYIALLHMHVSIVFHTVSCWLTILLAIWRYLAVRFPVQTKTWLKLRKSVYCIIAVYIIVPIYCIPCYLSFTVFTETRKDNARKDLVTHRVEWSDMAQNDSFLRHLNIWGFGVGSKLVPCLLLTYLSSSLTRVLIEADKRKRRLRETNKPVPKLKTNSDSSTNLQMDMTLSNQCSTTQDSHSNDRCLIKPTNTHLLKTTCSTENNSTVPIGSCSDSEQTNQTTAYSMPNNTLLNIKCDFNNNPNVSLNNVNSDVNQTNDQFNNLRLSAHNSINSSKERIDSIQTQKRNSTSSISKQSVAAIQGKELNSSSSKVSTTPTSQMPAIQSSNLPSHQKDRTTKMLISVLLIFLLTEFPSGILILLSSIIGNIIDLLALLNSSVNFILYCTMSKQFRQTFGQTILRRPQRRTEYSGVSKLKSNRKRKTKNSSNRKTMQKSTKNYSQQKNPTCSDDKSTCVFVTTSKC